MFGTGGGGALSGGTAEGAAHTHTLPVGEGWGGGGCPVKGNCRRGSFHPDVMKRSSIVEFRGNQQPFSLSVLPSSQPHASFDRRGGNRNFK
jgi:hypothetical protein